MRKTLSSLAILGLVALSSATLGACVVRSRPQPVYYAQPRPVYVQPRPVYVQPQPVYVQPQPVYVAPQPTTVYVR